MDADKLAKSITNAAGEYEACGHGKRADVIHGCQLFALTLQNYLISTARSYKDLRIELSPVSTIEEVARFVIKVNKSLVTLGSNSKTDVK